MSTEETCATHALDRFLETHYKPLSAPFRLRQSPFGLLRLGSPAAQGFTRAQLVRELRADMTEHSHLEEIDEFGTPVDARHLDFQALLPRKSRTESGQSPLESGRILVMTTTSGRLIGVLGYHLRVTTAEDSFFRDDVEDDESGTEISVTLEAEVAYVLEGYRRCGLGAIFAEEAAAQLAAEIVYLKALLEEQCPVKQIFRLVPTLAGEFVSQAGKGLADVLMTEVCNAVEQLRYQDEEGVEFPVLVEEVFDDMDTYF